MTKIFFHTCFVFFLQLRGGSDSLIQLGREETTAMMTKKISLLFLLLLSKTRHPHQTPTNLWVFMPKNHHFWVGGGLTGPRSANVYLGTDITYRNEWARYTYSKKLAFSRTDLSEICIPYMTPQATHIGNYSTSWLFIILRAHIDKYLQCQYWYAYCKIWRRFFPLSLLRIKLWA